MTIHYTVYDSTTGEILRTGSTMTERQANLQGSAPGTRVVLVGSDPSVDKVEVVPIGVTPGTLPRGPINVGGVVAAANKTTFIANGVDTVSVSPLPNGTSYTIEPPANLGIAPIPPGVVSDGVLTVTTTVPGTYKITLKYQTNQDLMVSLNAA